MSSVVFLQSKVILFTNLLSTFRLVYDYFYSKTQETVGSTIAISMI